MSLSQRYSGKFLAPWFNVTEWRTTRELIYSDSFESQQLALDCLKVWKLRTPLLSVGVEGTIILLEALLEGRKNLTNYEIAQIFSTALLRFLNICAAHNDRQGTFYKTAEKHDLPYWLITLRHDIAHDHKIPDKSLLECALKECFKWIKQKYWDVQDLYMKDYMVCNKSYFKELFLNYAQLNLLEFFKENMDELIISIKENYNSIIPENLECEGSPKHFLSTLEDFLVESVSRDKIKDSSSHIVSALVDEGIILSVNSSHQDAQKIPANFLHIWHKTINLLYTNRTLFALINKLMDVTEASHYEYSDKEIASLWISDLYQALIKVKKLKEELDTMKSMNAENLGTKEDQLIVKTIYDPQFTDTINLEESVMLPIEDSVLFQQRIIHNPNEYTMNYLELVLKFNDNTNDFVKKQCKIIQNLVQVSTTFYMDANVIYTLKDLEELRGNCNGDFREENATDISIAMNKFRKLTDAEKHRFKGYPLGLSPPDYT